MFVNVLICGVSVVLLILMKTVGLPSFGLFEGNIVLLTLKFLLFKWYPVITVLNLLGVVFKKLDKDDKLTGWFTFIMVITGIISVLVVL